MDSNKIMTSLILASFKRPQLLSLGLQSIFKNKLPFDLEIVVLNDGLPDGTEEVCQFFKDKLNIKYIFTGQRNFYGLKSRVPGFALNIGVKNCSGDIIVLSCPEIFHLNNSLDLLISSLIKNPKSMAIPEFAYFDKKGEVTHNLLNSFNSMELAIDFNKLVGDGYGRCHVEMPFLMAMYKQEFVSIGGYDEDFIGYAGDDNDLIERLKLNGLKHFRTGARIIHLWHEGAGDGATHYENPNWVHNWNLLNSRKGIVIRNVGREWGQIK